MPEEKDTCQNGGLEKGQEKTFYLIGVDNIKIIKWVAFYFLKLLDVIPFGKYPFIHNLGKIFSYTWSGTHRVHLLLSEWFY